ncbi:peptidase inhibitor family I36 protein [Streptomyces sp. NPDC006296]|uniref:peptidase inhibitor family I36 protein n=1 Tax=Streptomyces sp. NPDC006296 TaxID=3156746 RepID=UPI0033ADD1D7
MRSRAFCVAATAALALAGATLPAAPATAAASDCGPGQVCLFKDYDYKGQMLVVARFGLPHHDLKEDGFNDVTSSVINNSAVGVRLHQDVWYGGKYIDVNAGERIADMSRVHIYNADGSYFGVNTFNDRTSSTD